MNPAADEADNDRRLEEILHAYLQAVDAGRPPDRDELLRQHPELAAELAAFLADQDEVAGLARAMADPAPPAPPALAPTLSPGQVPQPGTHLRYFGDYELLEEVARGGMGVVFRARQLSLDRVVALKMILSGHLAGEADVKRFHAEARTAANLQHPNIVAIHEVGLHDGQHYFTMDYVAGRSLAELVRDNPLPPQRAAGYVRAVAEAIHYAHERGVLHRDLKPANVLIDEHDQPRVTDFGLAQRTDRDARLTASGAVIGTPSYMPPEQASGRRDQLGPASDVYSLGAVLYELVTGRPPFRAATPLDTMMQVMETEPAPPRLLNPSVNRDLETIILKCLAKDPARRYATARDLAGDLSAFLDGRPIQARRPGLAERAARWLAKRRRAAILTGTAAAASALLVIGSILGWGWYRESLQGQVTFTTDGQAYDVEVFDLQDRPVLDAFTAPTRQPVSLPAGLYHVRLSAAGRLSETCDLLLERGVQRQFKVNLDDGLLWPPLDVPAHAEVVELVGRADIIVVSDKGVRRLDGRTGKDVWPGDEVSLSWKLVKVGQATWAEIYNNGWLNARAWGRPWLVRPAPDLNGDGVGDLVWAGQGGAWVLAVSGKDGEVLWWYFDLPERLIERARVRQPPQWAVARHAVAPLTAHVGGDAVPAVLSVLTADHDGRQEVWAEAVSGRTGQRLWRSEPMFIPFNRRNCTAEVFPRADPPAFVAVAGPEALVLDLRNGQRHPAVAPGKHGPGWPLVPEPYMTPVLAELAGPGQPAALVFRRGEAGRREGTLAAVSLTDGKPLWERPIACSDSRSDPGPPNQGWPVVADLDGDGRPELIVPDSLYVRPNGWIGVELLDGPTGQSRWRCRLSRADNGPVGNFGAGHETARFLVGPDLDGDGCRDVLTAALIRATTFDAPEPNWWEQVLLVAAISGRDGRILWRKTLPLRGPASLALGGLDQLKEWRHGRDGRPQLLVNYTGWRRNEANAYGEERDRISRLYLFSLATGGLTHVADGLAGAEVADLNGDGLPDLYALRLDESRLSGKLLAYGAGPPEKWRRLGAWQPDVGERFPIGDSSAPYVAPPRPAGQADGDGAADVLAFQPAPLSGPTPVPLQAFSLRDGQRLWKAGITSGDSELERVSRCYWLARRPGDERSDVFCAYLQGHPELVWRPGGGGGSSGGGRIVHRLWLARLDPRTGRGWRTKLGAGFTPGSETHSQSYIPAFAPVVADLNGDGEPDVVVRVYRDDEEDGQVSKKEDILAVSGKDGSVLWKKPVAAHHWRGLTAVRRAGRPAVTLCCPKEWPSGQFQLEGWDGATGQDLWARPLTGRPLLRADEGQPSPLAVAADLDGAGNDSICVPVEQDGKGRILILDADGRERGSIPFEVGRGGQHDVRLFAEDLDGDGKADLLFVTGPEGERREGGRTFRFGGRLRAVRGDGKPLWRDDWPLPRGASEILGVVPRVGRKGAFVAVAVGQTVFGLDGATGTVRWRCEGPGRPVAVDPATDPAELPCVWFHGTAQDVSVLRQALAVTADGRYEPPALPPETYAPPADGDWLAVPLPWVKSGREQAASAVVPVLGLAGLVVFLGWRRRWRKMFAVLLALPVLVAAFAGYQLMQARFVAGLPHAWNGWPWIVPYVLATGGHFNLGALGVWLAGLVLYAINVRVLGWLSFSRGSQTRVALRPAAKRGACW